MDIELSSVVNAPIRQLWDTLLDPGKMARCIPGVQSVEVVSESEFVAQIQVRIAFISARFRVRTTITDMTPPDYLRCEATGEDSSVGSSVKSASEMFLKAVDENRTEIRVSTKATVLGKLGALGLNPMRTKAERMWEEFCISLEAEIAGHTADAQGAALALPATRGPAAPKIAPQAPTYTHSPATRPDDAAWRGSTRKPGLFARLGNALGGSENIVIELRRNDTTVMLQLPGNQTDRALAWLDGQLGQPGK